MKKETKWFEVQEDESIASCIERMTELGYQVVGRKEEPIFTEIDGKPVPTRQLIQLKGVKEVSK